MWQRQYSTAVQDATLLGDGCTAVVALRDSNLLQLVDHQALEVRCCPRWRTRQPGAEACAAQETGSVNLNARGDDHVSFYASHLALSPCTQYLLVSTEGPRLLLLRVKGKSQPTSAPLDMSAPAAQELSGAHACRLAASAQLLPAH